MTRDCYQCPLSLAKHADPAVDHAPRRMRYDVVVSYSVVDYLRDERVVTEEIRAEAWAECDRLNEQERNRT